MKTVVCANDNIAAHGLVLSLDTQIMGGPNLAREIQVADVTDIPARHGWDVLRNGLIDLDQIEDGCLHA